jgi:microcystin-dependent protein
MDAFMGTIMPVAFTYAPRGWMLCQGQIISIQQNSALFALLGTQYGGDGVSTFALPDLRARTLVGMGTAPFGTTVTQAQQFGTPTVTAQSTGMASVTLNAANLPPHNHTVTITGDQFGATSTLHTCSAGPGVTTPAPASALGNSGTTGQGQAAIYVTGKTLDVEMDPASVTTKVTGSVTATTNNSTVPPTPVQVPFVTQTTLSVFQPSLGMNFIICVSGLYPSRN